MNFNDLVKSDIKASIEAAEAGNFKTALNLAKEAMNDNELISDFAVKDANYLVIDRHLDYINDLMNVKPDTATSWLESYYAGSCGASAMNDVKNGRATTINI